MRRAALALAAGSLLALGAPAAWLLLDDPGPEQFGGAEAQELAGPETSLAAAPDAARDTTPPAASTGGAPVATRSARLVDVVVPVDAPVEVRVGGQAAAVDAVGLDGAGQVVVPDDVRRAGWYSPGALPGAATGSAVLVGHVDDRDQGLGTFAVLRELRAGAEVVVRTASGAELAYEVVALEQFDKAEVPLSRLFAPDGPHRLVLISCGGDFDRATGSYTDNVVVTAVPRP